MKHAIPPSSSDSKRKVGFNFPIRLPPCPGDKASKGERLAFAVRLQKGFPFLSESATARLAMVSRASLRHRMSATLDGGGVRRKNRDDILRLLKLTAQPGTCVRSIREALRRLRFVGAKVSYALLRDVLVSDGYAFAARSGDAERKPGGITGTP